MTLCPPGDCLPQKTIPTLQKQQQHHCEIQNINRFTTMQQTHQHDNQTHRPNRRELSYDLSIRDFGSGPEKVSQRVSIGVRKRPANGECISGVSSGGCITKFNPHSGSLNQKFKRVITKIIKKKSRLDKPLMLTQPLKNTRSEISQHLETRRKLWLVQRPNLLKI